MSNRLKKTLEVKREKGGGEGATTPFYSRFLDSYRDDVYGFPST
jgi:hypothetical protein